MCFFSREFYLQTESGWAYGRLVRSYSFTFRPRPYEIINKNSIGPASARYFVHKENSNEKGLAIQINNIFYHCLSSLFRISHLPLEMRVYR